MSTISLASLLPASNDLLSTLYGGSTAAGSGANPIVALQQAEGSRTKSVAATAKEPAVKRDIAAFRAAVATAPNLKALLANPVARRVLLTANGLGEQTDAVALAQKALASDPADAKSLANQLTDKRWLQTAKTYQFAAKGLAVLRDPKVLDTLASGYAEVSWRKSLDASTPGLSRALDFRDRAGTITSAVQILGDPVLRDVVTTALGLPKEIAVQSLEAQEKAITTRVDLTRFKDAKFVEQFTRRYLLAATPANTPATGVTGLFA